MKNLLKLSIAAGVFMGILSSNSISLQAKITENLRIGLEYRYKEVGEISVDNREIIVGFNVGDRFEEIAWLEGDLGFSVKADYDYYEKSDGYYQDYKSARNAARDYAHGVPAYVGGNEWRVYISGYSSGNSSRGTSGQVTLLDGGNPVMIFDSEDEYLQIKDANGEPVELDDKSYRGIIEFGRYNGKNLTAVNVLDYDSYLYSVIPSEMPAGWGIEALKAQAVASRSYTYTRNGIHNDDGYGLCDGVHCQVYHGYGNEAKSAIVAVDETWGLAGYYNNEIINATFFSSSGGVTADSETVWTYDIPYLRSVRDSYEENAKEWTRQFSIDEITDLLYANNIAIGSAVSLSVESVSPGGRVNGLRIHGTSGSHLLEKEAIRTFFAKSNGGSLESRYFTLSNGLTFNGRGYGHGVGMSQHGAKSMAEAGFTYEEILTHYYTDIEIR